MSKWGFWYQQASIKLHIIATMLKTWFYPFIISHRRDDEEIGRRVKSYKKKWVDPRWISKSRILCTWAGFCSIQRRSDLKGKCRDRGGEKGKRNSLGIDDCTNYSPTWRSWHTSRATGGGAGDRFLWRLNLSCCRLVLHEKRWPASRKMTKASRYETFFF